MSQAKTASRLESLIEISQLLVGTVQPDELLKVILESVMQLFEAEGCSLALIDPVEEELAFTTIAGRSEVEEFRLGLGQGIAGWVAATGEPVICNDVSADSRFFPGIDQKTGFKTHSILCAPLQQQARVIGAIEALNTAKASGFDDEDLELLRAFAGLAAAAIDRAKAFQTLRNANAAFRQDLEDRYSFAVGESPAMREVVDTARTAAAAKTTVLLLGESGTGKEVLARAIHRWSPRAEHPFMAVNCVALTPELLESELFGHEKGAFTGATAQKKGKFEYANGGTVFLDEIGDLAPNLQAKLLRVLQEREFQRVGGARDIHIDVRIVAATNSDLRRAMREGSFREDLFYRLNVVTIELPPLRERRDEIPPLAGRFLDRYAREMNRGTLTIDESAMEMLCGYDWPGNVRELQNAIERAVVLSRGSVLAERDFPAEVRGRLSGSGSVTDEGSIGADLSLADAVDAFKRERISHALLQARDNQTRAAEILGMRQSNLSRLMKTLGVK
jgi:Nif-specific regulatory protein